MTGAGDFDPDEDLDDEDSDIDYEAQSPFSIDVAEVVEFVEAYVYPWAVNRIAAGTGLWCPAWTEHPQVLVRAMELAISRQQAVADPTLPGKWWVDIFDRHLDRFTALDGPFRNCQAGHDPGPAKAKQPVFATVEAWFEDWFALVLTRRTPSDLFWCPGWQDHAEVHLQLTALWAAWEQARVQPSAMLGWWDRAHRTLGAITGPAGPFAACKLNNGHAESWKTILGQDVTASRDRAGRPRTTPPLSAGAGAVPV